MRIKYMKFLDAAHQIYLQATYVGYHSIYNMWV